MSTRTAQVAITGIGVLAPGVSSFDEFADALRRGARVGISAKIDSVPNPPGQSSRELRRLSRLARMAAFAAEQALGSAAGIERSAMGIEVALTHGSTSYLAEFHDLLFRYGCEGASPAAFSNGVTNAPLSTISTMLGLTTGGMTFVGLENAGLEMLSHAAYAIADEEYESCLAGAAEEYSPIVSGIYSRFGWYTGEKPPYLPFAEKKDGRHGGLGVSEGSAFVVLERPGNHCGRPAICHYMPLESIDELSVKPGIIISGAGGGPQDRYECALLGKIAEHTGCRSRIIFPKAIFGEMFGMGSMLSAIAACSLFSHGDHALSYPVNPLFDTVKSLAAALPDGAPVLVIAAGRNGQNTIGLFEKS